MYFVTTKREGYCLFSMTPSERAAIGLTDDQQQVHLLEREGAGWRVRAEWPVSSQSHTDCLLTLGRVPEPDTVAALLDLLRSP